MTFILLDNTKDEGEGAWLFEQPEYIIRADHADEVPAALAALEHACTGEKYCAGYFAFELAYLLEPSLQSLLTDKRDVPLLWFGVFSKRSKLTPAQTTAFLQAKAKGRAELSPLQPQWSKDEYAKRFQKVMDAITSGEVYELNLTFKSRFECIGDPYALYLQCRQQQQVSYGALINTDEFKILSLSPELFIRRNGTYIETRPMKGTAKRHINPTEDAQLAKTLSADIKSQAENLMIVDLMRNDLGRISEIGSVKVDHLYQVETYKTLHQMISTVHAQLQPGLNVEALLRALFAPGSIVGAPKIQAMKLIRQLEDTPRGVYCGAIGMLTKDSAVLNVAIRTLVLRPQKNGYRGELGIGSGIVYDSKADQEYEECLLKSKFLTLAHDFGLIETMRHDRGRGYYLLERHLARLKASAEYFGIPCDMHAIRAKLMTYAQQVAAKYERVRLVLSHDGSVMIESRALPEEALRQTMRFVIAKEPIDCSNIHLYHKTTQRAFLDEPCKRYRKATGCDEVVFLNEKGNITQGSYTNIFIRDNDGQFITPPIRAGLLPGTFREQYIATHRVIERDLTLTDLQMAAAIYLGNSVRGLLNAELVS